MRLVTTTRHAIEYAIVSAGRWVVAQLSERACRRVGTAVGLAFYVVDVRHRRRAVSQLMAAFPVRTEEECRAIARQTFEHFGRAVVGLLRMSTRTSREILAGIEFEGEDRVRTAYAAGKGVILMSGHFGYWEVLGLAHSLTHAPMSVIARPLDNPHLHALVERIRCATGNQVIYRHRAMRKVLRALGNNESVGILIDQHIHGADAVPVDFFGRPAATTSSLATLALRTGATVVPVFAIPLADGRCRIIYDPPVEMPTASALDPVLELTQRCSDVLEMYVRRHPQFWLWMHRRWRDEVPGDAPVPGMFPSAARDDGEARR